MDSLTQAVLGASIQGAVLGRQQGRRALFYGAILATLPDLDIAIPYPDPVSVMTYHRGFSHSLFALTLFSVLLAWLIRRWRPRAPYSGMRLWLAIWLVLFTHPLLDAFTSYGTQLLWPFMPTPAAWSSIFIIDPAYTLPLLAATLAAILFGVGRRTWRMLCMALALSTAYLAFTFGAKQVVEHRAHTALAAQGVRVEALFSGATPLNSLLWRLIAKDDAGHYYEGTIGLLDKQPATFQRLPLGREHAALLADSALHQRLRWFSGDWLRYDIVAGTLVVSDLRMGMLGHHFFRFAMAEHTAAGWQIIEPRNWPGRDQGARQLGLVWHRIWHEHPVLPDPQWDALMRAAP